MDIKNILDKNQIVLLSLDESNYGEITPQILKEIAGKRICYVTTNKTFEAVQENLQKYKINTENIVFIDTISKSIKKTKNLDQVYYVSNPGSLTELNLVLDKFLDHEFDYLIFDLLNNLMTYSSENNILKFLNNVIDQLKKTNTKAIFYALDIKSHENLIKQTGTLVDKTAKFSKI